MTNKKRKSIIDDGMNPELIKGAKLDGIFEIPLIEAPTHFIIPKGITPFTKRNHYNSSYYNALGFFEMDQNFSELLISPETYVSDFKKYSALISPDCSLYRDAPLAAQITNIYRNRALGCYYQRKGIYVIPQIRWGTEETYTTKVFPEKIAFKGAERHSIVSIGTYGCIQNKENKYHFEAGLYNMLIELEPKHVLVYGSMPNKIFDNYIRTTNFHQYDDWTTKQRRGDYNG